MRIPISILEEHQERETFIHTADASAIYKNIFILWTVKTTLRPYNFDGSVNIQKKCEHMSPSFFPCRSALKKEINLKEVNLHLSFLAIRESF